LRATNSAGETVGDVLIDRVTGRIAAVLVHDGAGITRSLPLAAVHWTSAGADLPPPPRGGRSRAWSDLPNLFHGQEPSRAEGTITEIGVDEGDAIIVKVHDASNLIHRVLVEPANLVLPCLPRPELRQDLAVEGVLTRDDKGKLLIACSLQQGDALLSLRDSSGQLEWQQLSERFQSARELAGRIARTADGEQFPVRDWVLDRAQGRVTCLCVEVDGVVRAVPWDGFANEGAGPWQLPFSRHALLESAPCPQ